MIQNKSYYSFRKMSNPRISIIVPVYNVEHYLRRCLESIVAQTFKDWECIMIDDGSSDQSGEICDEFHLNDSRFKVFHKENGGVSSARNVGLDNAKGEYICFCDSDDWVDSNWLEAFASYFGENIIVQGYKYRLDKGFQWNQINHAEQVLPVADAVCYLYEQGNLGYLWCRCFKRSIIEQNDLRFNERYSLCEDNEFIFKYLLNISCVSIIPFAAYNYLMPDYSGKKYKSTDRESDIQCTFSIIQSLFTIFNDPYKVAPINAKIERLVVLMFNLILDKKGRKIVKKYNSQMNGVLSGSKYRPRGINNSIKYLVYKAYTLLNETPLFS